MAAALKILSNRAISEAELQEQLLKDFANLTTVDQEVKATIAHLKDLHLLNDERIAGSLIWRYAHKGNRYIKAILAQKGIKEELITAMMSTLEAEEQRAFIEAKKKLRNLPLDQQEETKLYRFLTGRGFAGQSIKEALRLLKEANKQNYQSNIPCKNH